MNKTLTKYTTGIQIKKKQLVKFTFEKQWYQQSFSKHHKVFNRYYQNQFYVLKHIYQVVERVFTMIYVLYVKENGTLVVSEKLCKKTMGI